MQRLLLKISSKNYLLLGSLLYIFIFLVFFWFLTKFWLPPGYALVGHDSGLALDTKEFLTTRFYAWDQQGFGQDNSAHFGSIILHSIDYFLSLLAGVPYAGSHIAIFFWLSAIFIAGFIFAYSLREKLGNIFPFLFPVFITFNFFIFQSIFILERAKYSIFVALLLFLTIIIKFLDNKLSLLAAAILSSFAFFIFNSGSWLGVPLYASPITAVGVIILFTLLDGIRAKNFSKLRKLMFLLPLTLIGFVLLNSYALWPYFVNFTAKDYMALLDYGVIAANKAWLDSMSEATSYLNIFRLQGIPDWYAGSSAPNIEHAYAKEYLTNPLLIIASFIFPILAFLSSFLAKKREEKRMLALFSLLVLISVIFMAGTHPPFGSFYELLYDFVPGFSIFRSPYYKFGTAFILAISVLIAFSLSAVILSVSKRFTNPLYRFSTTIFLIGLSLSLWFGFHYVLLDSNKVFYWQSKLSTKAQPPDYIYEFKKWSIEEGGDKRTLLLPPLNPDWQNDSYEWGYWSLSTLPAVLTSKSIVANDRLLTNDEREWIHLLYQNIKKGDEDETITFARRLNVGYFLIRKDVTDGMSWSPVDTPEIYEPILDKFSVVRKHKAFGDWIVYKIEESKTSPKIFGTNKLTVVPTDHGYLGREFLKNDYTYILQNNTPKNFLSEFISKKADVYDCQSCLLERRDSLTSLPGVRILPNSPLYKFKILREKTTINKASTNQVKADAYLGFALVRAGEVETMIDTNIDEKYIIQDLETINEYLKNYYDLSLTYFHPESDYDKAKHLRDVINPLEKFLRNYISRQEFSNHSENFRQETLNVLWQIHTIRNHFLPLYEDRVAIEKEKIHFAKFPESGNYNLFVNIDTLSIGKGKAVLPSSVDFIREEKKETLKLGTENNGWIDIRLPAQEAGEAQIEFKFDDLPNQFVLKGSELRQSPTGIRSCIYGTIDSFKKNKKYNVSLKVTRQDQSLRMFFQEGERTKNPDGFIRGEDEVDIIIVPDEVFYHLYHPSGYASDPLVYLCSGNKRLPIFDEIIIHEIFTPQIVAIKETSNDFGSIPNINYSQINPTKYTVKVDNASKPFILYFNERYSQFWEITVDGVKADHFPLDAYANAWVINKEGSYELVVEYSLQKYFYHGGIITGISAPILLIVLLFSLLRRRHV